MLNRSFVNSIGKARSRRWLGACISTRGEGCKVALVQQAKPWSLIFPGDHHSNICVRRFSSEDNKRNEEKEDDSPPTPTIWKQLQSPPNIITLTRMASTPLLAYWVVSGNYTFAICGCTLAGISDYMDGYLAKRYGWSTVVGTYLDPVADKILINGLGISLWYSGILPTPLIAVWATKDILMLSGTAWYLYQQHQSVNFFTTSVVQKPLSVTPTTLSKVNTALQFATLGVGIVAPMANMAPVVLNSLCWVTGVTTVGSVFSYMGHSGFKL